MGFILFVLFCFILETFLIYFKIVLKLLCSQWPQSFFFWSFCLVLQNAGITGMHPHLCLCGTGDWPQDFIHSRKALWKQTCILFINYSVLLENLRGDYYINDLYLWKPVLHSSCCYLIFKFWTKSCRCWNLEPHVNTVII